MTEAPRDLVAFLCCAVGLLEWVSLRLMIPWAFSFGLPVMKRSFQAAGGVRPEAVDVESQVRVRAIAANLWIFRRASGWWDAGAALSVRGTAEIRGTQLVMTGRASVPLLGMLVVIGSTVNHLVWWAILAGLLVVGWFVEDSRFDSDSAVLARALLKDA